MPTATDYKLAILALEHATNRIAASSIAASVALEYPDTGDRFLAMARKELHTAEQAVATAQKLLGVQCPS